MTEVRFPSNRCDPSMPMQRIPRQLLPLVVIAVVLFLSVPTVRAIAPTQLSPERPQTQVVDEGDVLSRASRTELESRLEKFDQECVDARLVTLRKLDYGLTLQEFGKQLIGRWSDNRNN